MDLSQAVLLTTKTKALLRVAQTRTKIPAPRTNDEAIFWEMRRPDRHSIGKGIMMRYMSVEILAAKEDQTMAREIAG